MTTLASLEPEIMMIIFAGMAFVLILMSGIFWFAWHEERRKSTFKLLKEREQTNREIAAYVAEGSISPDDAERLIRAMGPTNESAQEKFMGVVAGLDIEGIGESLENFGINVDKCRRRKADAAPST